MLLSTLLSVPDARAKLDVSGQAAAVHPVSSASPIQFGYGGEVRYAVHPRLRLGVLYRGNSTLTTSTLAAFVLLAGGSVTYSFTPQFWGSLFGGASTLVTTTILSATSSFPSFTHGWSAGAKFGYDFALPVKALTVGPEAAYQYNAISGAAAHLASLGIVVRYDFSTRLP